MRNVILLLGMLVALGCEQESLMPTSALVAEPCPAVRETPEMIPGTDCENPCQYGYEGTIDTETGELLINCQVVSEGLSIYVDSTNIWDREGNPILAFTLETQVRTGQLQHAICSHDLDWRPTDPSEVLAYQVTFRGDPESGTIRAHIIPEQDTYWDHFEGGVYQFWLSTAEPLQLQSVPVP